MMRNSWTLYSLVFLFSLSACCKQREAYTEQESKQEQNFGWQQILQKKIPLLGHRNWIVVTDMAYPLQSKSGILTVYAEEPYDQVLLSVRQIIRQMPHVYPHVYQDVELSYLQEDLCPGIEDFRKKTRAVLSEDQIEFIRHEQLIARLDSACQFYQIIIIKTNLTKPYTSTFFELDCKYWNAEKQKSLFQLMEQ